MKLKTIPLLCACLSAFSITGYADQVAHWDFNEGSGITATDSIDGLIGDLQGNATWVAGWDGSAIQTVRDVDSQVLVGNPGALNITGAVTVMGWVKPAGASNYGIIAGIDKSGGAANDQFVLKTTAAGSSYLSFQATGVGGVGVTATDNQSIVARAAADDDGWIHVAGVFSPGEAVIIYINGEEIARTATSMTELQSTLSESIPFRIGNMTSSFDYGFNGALDEIRIFNEAVEANAIAEFAGAEVSGDDLVAFWNFNEGEGTTATDSVNGIVGTLQGNATWTEGLDGGAIQTAPDSESEVVVGAQPELNLTGAVTVAAWVHPAGMSNYGVIAGIDKSGGAANDQYVLKTTASGTSYLSFQATGAGGVGVTATDSISIVDRASADVDGWIHVAGVFSPGESVTIYVNGVQVAQTVTEMTELQSTLSESIPFRIGNMTSDGEFGFNGAIDDVRVYGSALTTDALKELADSDVVVEGEYLFSFGAVADPQYKDAATAGSRYYRNSLQKLPVMVTDFNARDLEFVICLGDFIDDDFNSYTVMMDIWDDIIHTAYHVVGNHDLSIGSHTLAEVVEVMKIPSNYYDYAIDGWRFFVLDGNDAGYGIHSDEQLAWLRDGLDLALANNESVILFSHYPVYPPGTAHISPQAGVLIDLIADYPNVRAWMNGHNHGGAYGENAGVHYINLEGMVETADTTAYAEIEIWTDRIEVKGEGREPSRTLYFPTESLVRLDTPTGLAAIDGGVGVSLSWDVIADLDVTELELEKRTVGENTSYETVAILTADQVSYIDTDAVSGVEYLYRIRALDDSENASDWSAVVSVELGFLTGQIIDLNSTTGEGNEIVLTWNLDGQVFDRLVLERRYGDSGEFQLVTGSLAGDVTTYTDTSLVPNSTYTYRIAGVASSRQTGWSVTSSATSGEADAIEGEAPGLVAYWPFDEGAGSETGDYSGNGLTGTILGSTSWTTGKLNNALQFTGFSGDEVVAGTPGLLNITGAVTVMAWVKPVGVSNYGVIAGIDESGGPSNDQYVLKTTTSGSHQLSFQVSSGGSGYTATDTVNLTTRSVGTTDGWVHVAGVFVPGEEVALYVNGEKVASTAVTIETLQSTLSTDRPFRIGNMTASSDYGFNGLIDELRVFASSVSPDHITAYASGDSISEPLGTVIEKGDTWAYLDDGSNQDSTGWLDVDFDDSGWSVGAAQLGYGDGDETTVISYGPDSGNKYVTTYLRKTFEVDSLEGIESLFFEVLRDDGVVIYLNGQEVIRDNMPSGAVGYQTYASNAISGSEEETYFEFSVSLDQLLVGTNVIAVELHNGSASSSDLSFDLSLTVINEDSNQPTISEEVIAAGYDWKYLDDGSDQGTAWSAVAFDDSAWATGAAQLGFGDGDEETVLSYGSDDQNKHITYYFRTHFDVADIDAVKSLDFGILRDDGVIVYLNGQEVIRDNMPAGAIDYQTFSSEIISGSAESNFYEFTVEPDYLVVGDNVLAVEIHNRDGTSSDLGFDLFLNLVSLLDPNAPIFNNQEIDAPDGRSGDAYAASIADQASDADGDEMFFSKVSGSDWLTIDPDGSLSGTPGVTDVGLNVFIVAVTDNDDGRTTAELHIFVDEPAELARASMPGNDEALVFGVIPDTQGSTNGVPVDEASAIAAQFIAHAPKFIIHVGDITDGNSSNGDTKFAQLEDLKALLVNPLAENGIGYYPVRGNHDSNAYQHTSSNVSAWAAAFPYLFSGDGAVIDPSDVPGGSESSPNNSNFCYVYDAGHDTFFVAVDQWNGGAAENYSNWVAEKFAEIRSTNPSAHIFGFSHSGLFASALHPAMSEFVSGGSEPYIEAGKQYEIDGWFSGHNHIYDRSMAINLSDSNKPYMFNFTCGSASEKFYALSRSPVEDQHINCLIDSTTIAGRPIAYLLVTINGPFVSVETYMSPDTDGNGTFNDWSVWDAYTYSRNGLQFTVASGENYNDRNIMDSAPEVEGFLGTSVRVIDGVNSDATTHSYGSTSFGQYRNITTGWWKRDDWYAADGRDIVSDIVSLNGMRETPGRNRCDAYTLVLDYDDGAMSPAIEEALTIVAFLDEDTGDADPGNWLNATKAILGTAATDPLLRAPLASDPVGSWGVDVDSNQVWARLDYQGDFAIAMNIIDTDKDGLSDSWELERFGSLDYSASDDPDNDGLTNIEEQAEQTNPLLADTDGDLFDDGVEVDHGLDPLSPNNDLRDSLIAALINSHDAQSEWGLYTRDALGGFGAESIFNANGTEVEVSIQLWQSQDLENWSPSGVPVERILPIGEGQSFYKWQIIRGVTEE
ncbi:LamG-like jellyroll fold domain-containing protein [Cerasicoccus arenae]|uniref:Fibronectin type-III domain-containing protein n=1 Tax=Cerasicoccus arenae TaxID=424488 RepID=A0A8J3DKB0_9BACT|nr:LamG-like jellyroll fold domain-containing protein [Cerasicoccus arenae]MBK1856831.1 metallophosphoesterase [Cerasicoccus arenae]GHC11140.1 hypothetical protein GCM10007047_30550 [Cerasicoccus arenae]